MKWTTEQRKINDLIPYAANPRQMTEKQNKDLTKSLEKFDLVEIPAINTDGTILAGHQRLRIMQTLGRGEELIDVRVPDRKLTEKEVQEYNIRSNKNTGDFDFDILANSFETADLLEWGFSEKELKIDVGIDEDEFDTTPPEEPVTKLGDIYQLGRHRLLCGNATLVDDMARLMGDDKANMVFTDPPYNVDYTGKTKDALKIENDKMSGDKFYHFLYDAFLAMNTVALPGCVIYICHADSEGYNFRRAMQDSGWLMKQCIVWVKDTLVMGRQDYQWKHEPILYGWKEGAAHYFIDDRTQTTVWEIERPVASREHPTMKPLALVAKALKNSSSEGGIVLDPFGRSGSTLIACEETNRQCRTMELSPNYCDVIVKRWETFTGKKAELVNG